MSKVKFYDPIEHEQRIWDAIFQLRQTSNEIARQIVNFSADFNLAKPSLIAVSYLFNHGIYAFNFKKILFIKPNVFRFYVKTLDNKFLVVKSDEINETIAWSHEEFKDEIEMWCDAYDNMVLIRETSPSSKQFEEQFKEVEGLCKRNTSVTA